MDPGDDFENEPSDPDDDEAPRDLTPPLPWFQEPGCMDPDRCLIMGHHTHGDCITSDFAGSYELDSPAD